MSSRWGARGFLFEHCNCRARIKESNIQLLLGGLSTDNKMSALQFQRLSSKPVVAALQGRALSLLLSPGSAERPSAEPGFWCELVALPGFCYLTVLQLVRMTWWYIKFGMTPAPSTRFGPWFSPHSSLCQPFLHVTSTRHEGHQSRRCTEVPRVPC